MEQFLDVLNPEREVVPVMLPRKTFNDFKVIPIRFALFFHVFCYQASILITMSERKEAKLVTCQNHMIVKSESHCQSENVVLDELAQLDPTVHSFGKERKLDSGMEKVGLKAGLRQLTSL